MDDQQLLDIARQAFLDAKEEIRRLRNKIAHDTCPLAIGDRITIVDGANEYDGIVTSISSAADKRELLDPVVGLASGWSVQGPKVKKDGERSKHGFGLSSLEAVLTNGKWVVTRQSLNDIFGI
ncbi:hypothetical protein GCM10010520_23380 [Rhizobium viscosum]|uniref:Uncharacterized protein n=1 Tax=Rhizobium viscosum TaxID=1673 RepID=A0ABR9IIV0_RHIVS|nr:hypothetical protein [Rhizobium viscosum]MBE1503110.1 hypothetical protein [Rhizobium viscosum]